MEVEKEERARQAADEERARIARELHDVISHGVSVMVVQAAAAEQVLSSDPDAARTALLSVQQVGREARLELRRMLGLIRAGDAGGDLAPAPGLAQLPGLLEQFGQAGLDVDLRVSGDADDLPAGVGLTAYRVVQEALTNAVKHGTGGRAELVVDRQRARHHRGGRERGHLRPEGDGGYGLRGHAGAGLPVRRRAASTVDRPTVSSGSGPGSR